MSKWNRRGVVGAVYFLHDAEMGRVKIGFTTGSIQGRVRQLQCGNCNKLTLLGVLLNKTKADESSLHRRFARWALPGRRKCEWFELTVEMESEIEALVKADGVTTR